MPDCFDMHLSPEEIQSLSVLALAHVGDAVYELLVRSRLCARGIPKAQQLHSMTVGYVSAPAQASRFSRVETMLTDEERTMYKRGRNTRVNSVPKGASAAEYHCSTGIETLFGWLYLTGQKDRIGILADAMLEEE